MSQELDPYVIEGHAKSWIAEAEQNFAQNFPEATNELKLAFRIAGMHAVTMSAVRWLAGEKGMPPEAAIVYFLAIVDAARPELAVLEAKTTIPDAFMRDADPDSVPGIENIPDGGPIH